MQEKLKSLILKILEGENLPAVEPHLREIPFEGQIGLALSNVFQIARLAQPDADKKELKKYATDLAELLAEKIRTSSSGQEFDRVVAEKGYVNCFFKPRSFARELIGKILTGDADWAKSEEAAGGKVMIEYSQPNTHKAFHIGHVRNVVTGAALVRCFRYTGRDTVAANYFGDIGSHVFKTLWYLENHESELGSAPTEIAERGKWLGEIYAKADGLLQESQGLRDEVWDILKPMSVAMKDLWEDESLINELGIDGHVRKIALNEEDLFENRSVEEVADLIEKLYKASIAICLKTKDSFRDRGDRSEVDRHFKELTELTTSENFESKWNRNQEIITVAERWSSGETDLVSLWKETRGWSIDDFDRIYSEIGAPFDESAIFWESEVEEEGLEIVDKLVKEGTVTESVGAKIVEIDKQLHERFGEPLKDKYRVLVLVRADGASLYGAKDLALAKRKFEDFDIDESIYVVGNEQKFYFQQLFQILRLMGFPQWEKCFHLSYELVMLPHGKISSRKGVVVLYDDVITELRKRAFSVVDEKNPGLDAQMKKNVAEAVAMGALIYGMLRVDTNKKIEFKFDEVLDFDGRSAPYIQYACARANSIFRKAKAEGIEIPGDVEETDFSEDLKPVEVDLLGLLGRFPQVVQKVVDDKKPIHLATYSYDLAVAFSDFYHQCPVLTADPPVRRSRMLLLKAVRITLEAALGLLGISAPEVM